MEDPKRKTVVGFISVHVTLPVEITIEEQAGAASAKFWLKVKKARLDYSMYIADNQVQHLDPDLLCTIQDCSIQAALESALDQNEEHFKTHTTQQIPPIDKPPQGQLQ